ncbi:Mitogen-activated protein kinase kinase kinase YODA [Hibiscus syriacus]|uniref:Mitogen-activated protein kinase kinase kinase YODA n=1 Tax=Hibiscus syriacus TaxID=106335 RepID=A0A6A3B4J1_HIBSY|nr:Mitogen-activated protein kinase kinase kinase YODA [Hibiscus syriacus]
MPPWWGKSSSKEDKKKTSKESLIYTMNRMLKITSDEKSTSRSGGSRRSRTAAVSERGSLSRVPSRSPSPSLQVSRCQSFVERPYAQPLPLPSGHHANVLRTNSGMNASIRPGFDRGSKSSLFLPLPEPGQFAKKLDRVDGEGDFATASISSDSSIDSDDPSDSRSPLTSDYENGQRTAANSPSGTKHMDQLPIVNQDTKETLKPANLSFNNQYLSTSPKRGSANSRVQNLQIPQRGAFSSALDSSMSIFLGSGHCSSPGSGHNSVGGNMSGQLLWPQSRCSPECSPIPSPRMTSPGPSSRIHSGAVTPLHPRATGAATESPTSRPDDGKQQSHRLPLPPITISNTCQFSPGHLQHPNIVQYYGYETVDDKLYIYLEYVSGGSIYKLLQEYGPFGESAIRNYTQQILSGLAYLHAKNTVHRDIKGANILVDPNGRVKLADFGMAKHITGSSCPLSFKGSPYWMAPEVIKNSNGCNLAVDIWSLGCTVLEMATTKPPWSQYEGVAAMFKIGNSKELPAIPDSLSDEGKDFVRQCLQRNPLHRPSAAWLLEHPFVKNAAPLERSIFSADASDPSLSVTNAMRTLGIGNVRNFPCIDSEGTASLPCRALKTGSGSSDAHTPRNMSCPVSPSGSPILHPRSPQNFSGRMSPSPISSPHALSGSSTPLTGGSGAIPFHHQNQPMTYLHEGIGIIPRTQNNFYANASNPYQEPKPDMFQGILQASNVSQETISSDTGAFGKQYGRPVLGDHVSQQLLRDHMKLKPVLDLNPGSSMLGRNGGI